MKKRRTASVILLGTAAVAVLGALIASLPGPVPELLGDGGAETPVVSIANPHDEPSRHAAQAREQEIAWRFNQGVAMLHAQQYDYAIKALHRVLELAPRMPEAHVNMGYAFLGGGDVRAASDFFRSAIELNPMQNNAYYGLALAAEQVGDMAMAIGAMRSYVHLSPPEDPYLAKARAALWEWQEARESATGAGDEPDAMVFAP